MKFVSILIREGRKEDLKKKYLTKFNEEDLEFILNISDLKDFNHKYTDFVLKNTDGDGELDTDELEKLVGLIKDFDKYHSQFPKKDINQYVSLNELEKVVDFVRAKKKEKELESQTEKIFENDEFLVLRPISQEASCKYGAGTKWCVTQKTMGHFERYTSGHQRLYFILRKKGKLGQPYYKIAVHFDPAGNESWWDANDSPLTNDAKNIFKEYNEDLYNTLKSDFDKYKIQPIQKVKKTFDLYQKLSLNSDGGIAKNKVLKVEVDGYENISDMPKHAIGKLEIFFENTKIDSYQIFITYDAYNDDWTADIGFGGSDDEDFLVDLGFEGLGFMKKFKIINPYADWKNVTQEILKWATERIRGSEKFRMFVQSKYGPIWKSRLSYGYTFGKNKGLIKKLVDWLDSGKKGTRLDFLVDIGILEKIEQDGKINYKRVKGKHIYKPTDLRGQYSSFFASAVLSGILKNVKEGRKFILTKGPNFEAFKEGKLKAL